MYGGKIYIFSHRDTKLSYASLEAESNSKQERCCKAQPATLCSRKPAITSVKASCEEGLLIMDAIPHFMKSCENHNEMDLQLRSYRHSFPTPGTQQARLSTALQICREYLYFQHLRTQCCTLMFQGEVLHITLRTFA